MWSIQSIAMTGAASCYLLATVGYVVEGRYWLAATLFFYAVTIGTLYMAGRS
jgi:hypothetical protein